jgi:hypothetical protein
MADDADAGGVRPLSIARPPVPLPTLKNQSMWLIWTVLPAPGADAWPSAKICAARR